MTRDELQEAATGAQFRHAFRQLCQRGRAVTQFEGTGIEIDEAGQPTGRVAIQVAGEEFIRAETSPTPLGALLRCILGAKGEGHYQSGMVDCPNNPARVRYYALVKGAPVSEGLPEGVALAESDTAIIDGETISYTEYSLPD